MKVCALAGASDVSPAVSDAAKSCAESLLKRLFEWRSEDDQRPPLADNALLVHLGLIKSEERKYRPPWDTNACVRALRPLTNHGYFPRRTAESIHLLLAKNNSNNNSNTISTT